MLSEAFSVDGCLLPPGTISLGVTGALAPGNVWVQRHAFEPVPLSPCWAALQHNALCARRVPFRAAAPAWRASAGKAAQPVVRSAADAAAFVLLDLGLTLFAQPSQRWRRCGKVWTATSHVYKAIRYFLTGTHFGQRPIFDGICA